MARCSASTDSAAPASVAAIFLMDVTSPAIRSLAWPRPTTVGATGFAARPTRCAKRRRAVRRLPSAAATCSGGEQLGLAERCVEKSAQYGVASCGAWWTTPRRHPRTARRSPVGPGSARPCAIRPQASVHPQLAAMRVTRSGWCATAWRASGRARCQLSAKRRCRPTGSPNGQLASSTDRPPGTGGTADLDWETSGASLRRGRRGPRSATGGLEAEGGRDGVLGKRPAGHPCGDVFRPARPADVSVLAAAARSATAVTGAHHQRGIEHVLAGESTVQPAGPVQAGSRRECSGGSVQLAPRRGCPGASECRSTARCPGRDDRARSSPATPAVRSRPRRGVEPGPLHGDHRGQDALVGEESPRAFVTSATAGYS